MPSYLIAAEARTAVMVLAAVAFWGDDHCVGVHGLCTVVSSNRTFEERKGASARWCVFCCTVGMYGM